MSEEQQIVLAKEIARHDRLRTQLQEQESKLQEARAEHLKLATKAHHLHGPALGTADGPGLDEARNAWVHGLQVPSSLLESTDDEVKRLVAVVTASIDDLAKRYADMQSSASAASVGAEAELQNKREQDAQQELEANKNQKVGGPPGAGGSST